MTAAKSKKREVSIALGIFIILSIIFLAPLFKDALNWGDYDWDQHFFYTEAQRKTLLVYKELPFWNPYYCGGNVLLAHPESSWLSPFFVIILMFGTVIGLKVLSFLYFLLGTFGMYLLAKEFQMSRYASYFPPMIFMFSSWYVVHTHVGHTLYFTFSFLPYAFLFFKRSINDIRYIFASSLAIVLITFGGGATYPLLYTCMVISVYAIAVSVKKKTIAPVVRMTIIFLISFLLGAVKFVPMSLFITNHALHFDDKQPTGINTVISALLSKEQGVESRSYYSEYSYTERWYDREGNLVEKTIDVTPIWKWHEYSAYIGIVPFILFMIALFVLWKKHWDLILSTLFFFSLTLGDSFILYPIVRNLPIFSSLHGPSRFIVPLVFLISLLVGLIMTHIEATKIRYKKTRITNSLVLLLAIWTLFSLFIVNMPLSKDTFPQKPLDVTHKDTFFQVYTKERYVTHFPNVLQNIGTLNCYERIKPPLGASPYLYEDDLYPYYKGEAYLLRQNISQEIKYWSPNKITVNVETDKDDILILNENYYDGWKADSNPATEKYGKVAASVTPEETSVQFRYVPPGFILGTIISVLTMIISIGILIRHHH